MTRVSKLPVEKDVYFDIVESFVWLLSDIKSEKEMLSFFKDFFTKTERLMLAKRLATALMVVKGHEVKTISYVLKVSTATVYRVREWVDRGGPGLQNALQKLLKQEKMERFWKRVDRVLEEFVFKPYLKPPMPDTG